MTYMVYLNKGYAHEQLLIATGNRENAYNMASKYKGKGIVEILQHKGTDIIQLEQYL